MRSKVEEAVGRAGGETRAVGTGIGAPGQDAGRERWPPVVRPMLATLGSLPPAGQDGLFGYEFKWDGVRAVVYLAGGRIRLLSRTEKDMTLRYPELAGLAEEAGGHGPAVLDGEIVAFDETGRPSFAVLQQRMQVADPAEALRLVAEVPVTLLLFDVLRLHGRPLLDRPYTDRRALLEQLELTGPSWQTPPAWVGGGADVLAASLAQRLEGVVAKRLTSTYTPGTRSRAWIKVKNVNTLDVLVGGWTPGQGRRAGTIGALLLGVPTDDGLRYVGHVGTGFTDSMLTDLSRRLTNLARPDSPFTAGAGVPREAARGARWVDPVLLGEVAYGEWTPDGVLRHPSWRGLRDDVTPPQPAPRQP